MIRIPRKRIALLVTMMLAMLALGATAYAFTAANTVPASRAGSGTATVSGYAITNIDYTLNSTDPDDIDKVEFNFTPSSPAPEDKYIEMNGVAYPCTVDALDATKMACTTTSPQADVAALTTLGVILSD